MPYTTLTSGLTIKVPTRGTRSWAQTILDECFRKISSHDHTGSPKGLAIGTNALSANAVDDTKIRLRNNQYLRARNAANSADIDILKVGTDDLVTFPAGTISGTSLADSSVTDAKLLLRNNNFLKGRNAANSASYDLIGVDSSNHTCLKSFTGQDILLQGEGATDWYIRGSGGHLEPASDNSYKIGLSSKNMAEVWSRYFGTSGGTLTVGTESAHSIILRSNATDRFAVNSSGHIIPQGTTKTLDIGATSTRLRAIYGETLDLSGRDYATWTPTTGGSGSMTVGSVTNVFSRYSTDQKTVTFETNLVFTTSGSASDTVTFTLPVAPKNTNITFTCLVYDGTKASGKQACGVAFLASGSTVSVRWYDNSNWTLAVGCALYCRGAYEIN